MALITTVLNYFRGDSPKTLDDHSTKEYNLRSNGNSPSGTSPRLFQMDESNIQENGIVKSKKRTRVHSFDEDDEVVTSAQKKRRIYFSASDDIEDTATVSAEVQDVDLDTSCTATENSIADTIRDVGVIKTYSNSEQQLEKDGGNESLGYEENLIDHKHQVGTTTQDILGIGSDCLDNGPDKGTSRQESRDKRKQGFSSPDTAKEMTRTKTDCEKPVMPHSCVEEYGRTAEENMVADECKSESTLLDANNNVIRTEKYLQEVDENMEQNHVEQTIEHLKQAIAEQDQTTRKSAEQKETVEKNTTQSETDNGQSSICASNEQEQDIMQDTVANMKQNHAGQTTTEGVKEATTEADQMAIEGGKEATTEEVQTAIESAEQETVEKNMKQTKRDDGRPSTCAKGEQEEDMMQETLIAQQISEGFLTDSMLDQEKKLHQKHMEEEKEIVNQAMAEWECTIEQQRYTRLQHLLEKSNVYSSFLLQRIEKQKEEKEKEKTRKTKKSKKEEAEEPAQTVPDKRRTRKAKGMSSSYDITDYVDQEALKKNSQKCELANRQDLSSGHGSKTADGSQNETSSYEQPKLLTGGSLRDYQIEGVEWLKVLFENGVNGILADEMGLGKTIQCIALLAHLIQMGVKGPFLVTAPLSTLPNWLSEFKRFTPTVSVVLYHGNPDERTRLRKQIHKLQGDETYKSYPVVITSYEIIMRDRKYLDKYVWKYVIVDEGHRIKNLKCRLIRELKAYPSANRLLLTGTPLQNNLSELWSLLNFLLPDIFNDLDSFQAWFDFSAISESGGNEKIIAQEREHHVLERLHAILSPFLLRRLKMDVNIDVPRKKEVLVYAPLTQKQEQWYKLFLDKTRLHNHFSKKNDASTPVMSPSGRVRRRCSRKGNYEIFDDDSIDYEELMGKLANEEEDRNRKLKESAVPTPKTSERNVKLLNVIMQLRKTCNHPYLLEYPLVVETQQYRIDEELITCCGKMLILDQMMAALKEKGHKVLLFSQMTKMLDILEDFCYLRKYSFSRIDGSMNFEDRQAQIEDFNSDPSVLLFLLSTRAGGLGLNLTAADTVILYDSDWNPQQDLQAQDRCHRIGQTKPVVVYRFLTVNTVDQKIVERAADKRKLEKMIIHKGKFKGVRDNKKISANEMMELLESSDHNDVVNTDNNNNGQVLSEEQLNKLLDRSDLLGNAPLPCEGSEDKSKLFKVVGIVE